MDRLEFRFSVVSTGQGHYTGSLPGAIEGALDLSRKFPGDDVVVEQFRPVRARIHMIRNGHIVQDENSEKMRMNRHSWFLRTHQAVVNAIRDLCPAEIGAGHTQWVLMCAMMLYMGIDWNQE